MQLAPCQRLIGWLSPVGHLIRRAQKPILCSPTQIISRDQTCHFSCVSRSCRSPNDRLLRKHRIVNKSFQLTTGPANNQLKRKTLEVKRTELQDRFKMEWPKITLFGDSITRRSFDAENGCWGSMIAYKVNSFFDVDPRGFEGYNSKWGFELMPKLFPKTYLDKVELFVLFFGHNDSWEAPPMHLPLEEYNTHMRNIVKYLIDNGLSREKIILITPSWFYLPDFTEYLKSFGMPPIKKELKDCEKYSEIVKKIGTDERLEVLDFFSVTANYQPLEELFCDGVHFSRKGAKLLFDHLMPVIEKKIEGSFNKPLADLWHGIPFDQHPEMRPVLEEYAKKLLKQED